MGKANKKIALLHRHTPDTIKETNAAFTYLREKPIDVLTFKRFKRISKYGKFFKSLAWIFYAPMLVIGRGYDVIYCDDSYPFYPILVKLVSPKSRVILRIGDFHLMYYTSGKLYRALHFIEKIGWRMADRIIAISDAMGQRIESEIHSLVPVIDDPIDIERFKPMPKDTEENIVMFHGVLTANKGLDMLVGAANFMQDVSFHIIGDGPERRRLESIAPKNVKFFGWVGQNYIPNYIKNCSVGVAMRSENEGNQYVLTSPFLQYGAMGKPCLVSKRIVYGSYKWQFRGVEGLVRKLRLILQQPNEGEALRKEIVSKHDAKRIAEDIWSQLSY